MSEENINLINKIYSQFNNRQYDALVENFGEEFVWYAADSSPLADHSPYHGIKEIREGVFGRIEAAFSRLNVLIDEIIDAGEKIIILGYYEGEYANTLPSPRAQLAHVWTISNNKAVKFQQYVDTYVIARSMQAAAR